MNMNKMKRNKKQEQIFGAWLNVTRESATIKSPCYNQHWGDNISKKKKKKIHKNNPNL